MTFPLSRRRFVATSSGLAAAAWLPGATRAQSKYPERPLRVVVPFAPGGDGDVMARYWAKTATQLSGIQFVIDNKGGGGGSIGASEVSRAKADGYTLLLGTTTTQIINPLALPAVPYDPIKDFSAVGMVSVNPTCIVVNPSVPAKTLGELVALAKAQPGKLSYGSAGSGTITNLTGELFKFAGGKLAITHVPYKGGGPAMADLMANHVPIITPIMSSAVLAQHRAGKARILAVNSPARLKVAPDIPTSAEAGLPDLRVQVFNALFVPAGTPPAALDTLRELSQKVLADPGFVKDVENAGAELLVTADPDKHVREEVARWTQVVKATNFKVD